MTRKPCPHGVSLPKGLRCNHGYLEVLLNVDSRVYCKTFGPHTREAEAIANIHIAEKRKEILLGKFGMAQEAPRKKFGEVAALWFNLWKDERNPDGTIKHNAESCYKVKRTIDGALVPRFGHLAFDDIRPQEILAWRQEYISKGLSGTTANRYQAVLSSIYSHVSMWVKTERIKPAFKLPAENPCDAVEMAPQQKRTRILTRYEAAKLKLAFGQLGDLDGWEICKMALKSVLSMKDLKNLEIGQEIDTSRSKTGVRVNIPIANLVKLDWYGWRTRWEKAREKAGLTDLQFRDLRKTGINWMKGKFDLKLISEYAGHADIKTTEKSYTIKQSEYLEPLAKYMDSEVDLI